MKAAQLAGNLEFLPVGVRDFARVESLVARMARVLAAVKGI